jgi:phosphatidylinositol alpha-1,6-mannosyltransferase
MIVPGPRTLLISRVFPPKLGGIERLIQRMHMPLSSCTQVVTPRWPGSQEYDRAAGWRVFRTAYLGSRYKLTYLPLAARAAVRAFRERPEVIVCDQLDTAVIGAILGWLVRVPFVVFTYNAELDVRRGARLLRWCLRRAARIVAISEDTAARTRAFVSLEGDPVRVIYPGVDGSMMDSADRGRGRRRYNFGDEPVLLTVGRLDTERYKGMPELLRAFALVTGSLPAARLLVVGDGSLRPQLEKLAAELGIDSRVVFAGAVDDHDLADAYSAADVFAMLSTTNARGFGEGFGIVYMEAALAGLPSVYSESGGASEAVLDGVTGLKVDVHDAPAAAAAILRLLTDPGLRSGLGQAGRRRALDQFSWERVASQYVEELKVLTSRPGAEVVA